MTLSGTPPLDMSYVKAWDEGEFIEVSIADFFRDTVAQVPDRLALVCALTQRRWSYRELLAEAEQVAQALLGEYSPGDHVATWAGGSADILLLHLGAALAGLVLVTINPASRADEVEYMLRQSAARGLFADRMFRDIDNQAAVQRFRASLPLLRRTVYMDEWPALCRTAAQKRALPQVAADSPGLILFTSGTTGKPKAAVLRHAAVVNNARLGSQCLGLAPGGVWLNLLPMFHIGGSATITLGCFANLGTQVLLPVFSAEAMLDAVEKYGVTVTMAVPTMLVAMLQSERFADTDLRSLKTIVTGGTVIAPELVKRVKQATGASLITLFGQTEASGTLCVTRTGDDMARITQTVGTPLPLSEIKIISAGTGQLVPVGEIGEICLRSRTVMAEYFGMPEQTAATLDSDGWLHTGDMGYMRADGYIQITGRLKEMIIRGGENIYPREVEDILAEHPAVSQSAVFGVPDDTWGEQVAAAVIFKPGAAASKEELANYLRERIARHKVPKIWRFRASLPVNASGKIQKFLLTEEVLAGDEK